ncbi:MAG: serine--tRNA ligase [Deltaproteobacteria bacterium]|nr:serine--tRNA ligase [Deltaproteobacteria bacterium]
MLDLKFICKFPERVKEALRQRNLGPGPVDDMLSFNERRTAIIHEVEELKRQRNEESKKIGELKRRGEDVSALVKATGALGDQIKRLDENLAETDEKLNRLLLEIPNFPHETVPVGKDAGDNRVERSWGDKPKFKYQPLSHDEIGVRLGILDFDRASKITGARFVLYKGLGARLERALINFMLELHTAEHGYVELLPPFIVNEASLNATGQLPKFSGDLFKLEGLPYYLVPTAEVPVTNIFREEVLEEKELPLSYAAYTPCFRSEAGSYGKDTKGLIRQHQFNKVELVKFTKPEESYSELEKLTAHAERILQLLELPYRVVSLCTGDLGFASAKTYDLEVWLPAQNRHREISSCSNFEAFQARRGSIKFRRAGGRKLDYVHTLNGSGLAVGRTVVAILENHQQPDGSVRIPKALQSYFGAEKIGF